MAWPKTYIDAQRTRLVQRDGFPRGLRDRLRTNDFQLCVLHLDIRRSLTRPEPSRESIRDNLVLMAATDIAARGGYVIDVTDGCAALFFDPWPCIQAGIVLHHRKQEMRSLLDQPQSFTDGQAAAPPPIDFRVCLSRYPAAVLESIADAAASDAACERRICEKWREAESRYGNEEDLLADTALLGLLDASVSELFQQEVPLNRLNYRPGEHIDFWGEGFRRYTGAPAATPPLTWTFPPGVVRPELLEAGLQANLESRRNHLRALSQGPPPRDLYRLFPLEPVTPRKGHRAVVLGDVNVDYVTTLSQEEAQNIGRLQHAQDQREIIKDVGGKGLLTARALNRYDSIRRIDLVAKLGFDLEMTYVLQRLRQQDCAKITPRIFISTSDLTGTTMSVRLADSRVALLTITNKPNANSQLTKKEADHILDELATCDLLFISGYAFLDGRAELALELARRVSDAGGKVILELSPARLLSRCLDQEGAQSAALRDAIDRATLVIYESNAFSENASGESDLLSKVPHHLKLDFKHRSIATRAPGRNWRQSGSMIDPDLEQTGAPLGVGSVGLMSRLGAKYINDEFVTPRIILCGASGYQRRLLEAVYGANTVYEREPWPEAWSPDANPIGTPDPLQRIETRPELRRRLLTAALSTVKAGLLRTAEGDEARRVTGCHVAIASARVVCCTDDSGLVVLEPPDDHHDPIGEARRQIGLLSDREHHVVTGTVIIKLRALRDGARHWTRESVDEMLGLAERKIARAEFDGNAEEELSVGPRSILIAVILVDETPVRFRAIAEEEKIEWLAAGEWRGRAGAYALQGSGGYFIEPMEGVPSWTNVVGLPIGRLSTVLARAGLGMPRGQATVPPASA